MRVIHVVGLFPFLLLISCSQVSEEELLSRGAEAFSAGEYGAAKDHYLQVFEEYPRSPSRPDVLYALGTIAQNSDGDFSGAVTYFRTLAEEFPDHPRASNALFLVGFILHNDLGLIDSARTAYEEFLSKYPDHEMSSSVRFELENLGKKPDEIVGRKKNES